MEIINPTAEYEQSYIEYIKELGREERYPYPLDLDHTHFTSFVDLLNDYSKGINLPKHMVPNTTFWLVDGSNILGCSHLRHCLNEQLLYAGGHIGLGIRPSARGQGLSTLLLTKTLQKAFELNITTAHIHCYENNVKSQKMILSVGGVLDSFALTEQEQTRVLRYIVNNDS